MSVADRLYQLLPTWGQNAAVTLYGLYWNRLRFGAGFRQYLQEFTEREYWGLPQWREWQNQMLVSILNTAAKNVPYYQNTWNDHQKKAAAAGQLGELPLLEKTSLRSDPKAFLRKDIDPGPVKVFYTSGSTGTPVAAYFTLPELRRSMALREVRSARWAGVSFSQARATFSGRLVVPDPNSSGPFHRFNAAERQVYLSAYHLRPDNASQYVQAMTRHKSQWGTGYAVSFFLLARYILAKGIEPPGLKAIITTSEKLTTDMRQIMQEAYRCKVFEEYSTVENAVFASECEHQKLHVSPDAGFLEILRPDGSPCSPGEVGEVVVTSFLKQYQPLVRFRLGDLASWDPAPCPCGRTMPAIGEIVGRTEDVITGPDGRQLVRFHGVFIHQPHILEGQVIQDSLDHIRVKVVPTAGFNELDTQEITRRIQQRLGSSVNVSVEVVKSIPRTKSGKFQAVISNINKTTQNRDDNDG